MKLLFVQNHRQSQLRINVSSDVSSFFRFNLKKNFLWPLSLSLPLYLILSPSFRQTLKSSDCLLRAVRGVCRGHGVRVAFSGFSPASLSLSLSVTHSLERDIHLFVTCYFCTYASPQRGLSAFVNMETSDCTFGLKPLVQQFSSHRGVMTHVLLPLPLLVSPVTDSKLFKVTELIQESNHHPLRQLTRPCKVS